MANNINTRISPDEPRRCGLEESLGLIHGDTAAAAIRESEKDVMDILGMIRSIEATIRAILRRVERLENGTKTEGE